MQAGSVALEKGQLKKEVAHGFLSFTTKDMGGGHSPLSEGIKGREEAPSKSPKED